MNQRYTKRVAQYWNDRPKQPERWWGPTMSTTRHMDYSFRTALTREALAALRE